jgi:hypothetical protein
MVRLFIVVEDVAAVLAESYTHIRVYTDTSATGAFATLDGTVALVAGQESYEYTDSDGTDATWYQTAYYGNTPGLGDRSAARKGETAAAYATVKELRYHIGKTVQTDDWELAQLLDAAARAINRFCNRPDGFVADPTATARTFSGSGQAVQRIDECYAVTTVAVKDSATDDTYTAWGTGDWIAFSGDPEDPDFNSTPFTWLMIDPTGDETVFTSGLYTWRRGFRPSGRMRRRGTPTVQVTGRWGYADAPPADIKIANLMQAARWYKRLQSSMADAAASLELGSGHSADFDRRQVCQARDWNRIMANVTLGAIVDAVEGVLDDATTLARSQTYDELTESIPPGDMPLLQVYPEGNPGVAVGGTTDRTSFGGGVRVQQYVIHADYYARQRSHIDEDMKALVDGIDAMEAVLVTENLKPYFGLSDDAGNDAIESFNWSWSRVTFVYGDAQTPYVGARFVINVFVY